ncbi:MAG: transposase [Moorea sp. SIO2B7]|nr:transposase [Moorena sp. SIO2B7]
MTEEESDVTQTSPPGDYDKPWKEGLEQYLEPFLAFCFPDIHALIDWSKNYQSLDQELQQVVRDAELGKRLADKLFQVWLNDNQEAWILINIEVQGQHESNFAERMFIYNYRCYDRHRKPVLSLAVLGDDNTSWRPSTYSYAYGGCEMKLTFPIVKLLDYETQWEDLEESTNPFAVIVMAHLKTKATIGNPQERKKWKWSLIRRLFERGYSRKDVLELFRLVDWMMTLPDELQQELRQELRSYQEERKMPFMSRIELMAKEEVIEQGTLLNARESVIEALEVRFNLVPLTIISELNIIEDVARLKQLHRLAISINSVEEFEQILRA